MVVAFYFRLHLAYFPRPVVAIFARPEHERVGRQVCRAFGTETGITQRCGTFRNVAYWKRQSGRLPRL